METKADDTFRECQATGEGGAAAAAFWRIAGFTTAGQAKLTA